MHILVRQSYGIPVLCGWHKGNAFLYGVELVGSTRCRGQSSYETSKAEARGPARAGQLSSQMTVSFDGGPLGLCALARCSVGLCARRRRAVPLDKFLQQAFFALFTSSQSAAACVLCVQVRRSGVCKLGDKKTAFRSNGVLE